MYHQVIVPRKQGKQNRIVKNIYLVLDTDWTSQKEYMFNLVHLKQEEGQQLDGVIITIYTNFFLVQQEYIGIISPSKKITATSLKQCMECLDAKNLIKGIRNKEGY